MSEQEEQTETETFDTISENMSENLEESEHVFSQAEDSLQQKNEEIASTLKKTIGNLTSQANKRTSQREELDRAQALQEEAEKQPSWVLKVKGHNRSSSIQQMELKRKKRLSNAEAPQPDWIEKAKQAQISRDLRGLDRFLNQKAPALPPEPEWLSKACKRRDLTKLLGPLEKTHVSNKEAPIWVQSSNAQKILNSFLHEDEGVIPDWMKKGVEMTNDEKTLLMEQLEQLKKLLEDERKLTAERETHLASLNDSLETATEKLDESISSYRSLRENRKNTDVVKSFIDSTNDVFNKNKEFMDKTKKKFELENKVQALVERQVKKENAVRENREKEKKKKGTNSKGKKAKKGRTPNIETSADVTNDESLEANSDKEVKKKRRKTNDSEKKKKKKLKE